jgi:hypothetical protein
VDQQLTFVMQPEELKAFNALATTRDAELRAFVVPSTPQEAEHARVAERLHNDRHGLDEATRAAQEALQDMNQALAGDDHLALEAAEKAHTEAVARASTAERRVQLLEELLPQKEKAAEIAVEAARLKAKAKNAAELERRLDEVRALIDEFLAQMPEDLLVEFAVLSHLVAQSPEELGVEETHFK